MQFLCKKGLSHPLAISKILMGRNTKGIPCRTLMVPLTVFLGARVGRRMEPVPYLITLLRLRRIAILSLTTITTSTTIATTTVRSLFCGPSWKYNKRAGNFFFFFFFFFVTTPAYPVGSSTQLRFAISGRSPTRTQQYTVVWHHD